VLTVSGLTSLPLALPLPILIKNRYV
jgi:hypothetical protein